MDTFDGIFAGKKKRLKAMKDSKVGSFGVQALVFITLIQIACILKIQNLVIFVLPVSLFWGRFSNLFFIEKFKYMSYKKKSISHKKFWNGFKKESLISIIFLLIFISYQFISITSKALLIKFLILHYYRLKTFQANSILPQFVVLIFSPKTVPHQYHPFF